MEIIAVPSNVGVPADSPYNELFVHPDNAMAFGLAVSEHTYRSGHISSDTSLMLEPPCVENRDTLLQDSGSAGLITKIDNVRKRTSFFLCGFILR